MPKYLSINQGFSGSPGSFYTHIQQHYSFSKTATSKVSLVKPFVIITDRSDIVMLQTPDLKQTAGFECSVPKKGFHLTRGLDKFNDLITMSVFKAFYENFSDLNVTPKELSLLSTIRAIYSLDQKTAYSFYFLTLPGDKVVKFKPKNNLTPLLLPIKEFVSTALINKSLDLVSKSAAYLIAAGEMDIPAEMSE